MTPNFKKSKWVGGSCASSIIPFFFIKGKNRLSYFLRVLCIIQIPVAYLSDYTYSTDEHIIHGIDRITATLCFISFIYVTARHNSIINTLIYIFIPTLMISLAKYYCNTDNEKCYNIVQILWHYSTAFIASFVLYDVTL